MSCKRKVTGVPWVTVPFIMVPGTLQNFFSDGTKISPANSEYGCCLFLKPSTMQVSLRPFVYTFDSTIKSIPQPNKHIGVTMEQNND